jgi:hypothetical protein
VTHIPSHKQLDPARKNDIDQALAIVGKTLKDLLYDVVAEIKEQPVSIVPPVAVQMPASVAQRLIDDYVSPAWFVAHKEKDQVGLTHFQNLADNLRMASGIPLQPGSTAPFKQLHKSNAQEIIFRWLSPEWYTAKSNGDKTGMLLFNNLANHLRKAAGMPVE